jgi:outer membrane protein
MFRAVSCFLVLLFISSSVPAQTVYTLQQCIDTAIANNIPVRQSDLQTQAAFIDWRQSRSNLLPDLNANMSHGLNSGRSIDPFTNTYSNQSITAANYGLSSGIVLFNGSMLQNRVKQNRSAYEASKMELQQAKDNLVLNVILAYLQVLNNEDQVDLALTQATYSQKELDRLSVLNSQGAIKPSDVSDLKGQLMNDQLNVLNGKNQLETSKLNLAQLMNIDYNPSMKLERMNVDEFLTAYTNSAVEVYKNSLETFSLIKSVELRKKSNEYALKAERGGLYPTLSLGASVNTNYSSIAKDASGKIGYSDQISNNRYTSVGLGLRIPIFNASLARNKVKLASINVKNSELVEAYTKTQLRQQIEQAYLNMTNAYERYKVLLQQMNAYTESFNAATVRYNSGVGSSLDYLTAKDRVDRANINLINAKYDFVLRKRVLDYYNGK